MGKLPAQLSDAQLARIAAQDQRAPQAASNEAYRWARIDRRTQHFQPAGFSGDTAVRESHDLMHRRTRSEGINNAQVHGIERDYADLIVGAGMQVFADPFLPWDWLEKKTFNEEEFYRNIRYMLEGDLLFDEWASCAEHSCAEGRFTWWDQQRMAIKECVRVGFCLLLKVSRADEGRLVPRCYQLIEREQLDTSKDRPPGPNQNRIVNGVEVDRSGRIVAAYLLDSHPYDYFSATGYGSQRITRDRFIPVGTPYRPSETVGVTWLHAIGQNGFDRDAFVGNEIAKGRKQSLIGLVHKTDRLGGTGMGMDDGTDNSDQYGNELVKMGTSPMAARIKTTESIDMVESKIASNAEPFMAILDHDTAHALGLSYYTLTGRYEQTSFSSANAAKNDESNHMTPLQMWFANQVAIPVRREINTELIVMNKLKELSWSDYVAEKRRFDRFEAVPTGRNMIDPEKETDAAIAKLRSGQTTLKRELARGGLHWIKVLLQRAMENEVTSRLGVVLDFSKGQGGQVERSTSAAKSEEADA